MDNQKNNFFGNNQNADTELDTLFREVLQHHSVPTDDHVWRRIQNGLADKEVAPITKTITKRTYLPIWSAVSGVAASLLIWAIFFAPSTTEIVEDNSTTANTNKVEIKDKSIDEENKNSQVAAISSDESLGKAEKNNQEIQNIEATSSKVVASNKQTKRPTITIKQTVTQKHIEQAVASMDKDQTKIKKQQAEEEMRLKSPSTHIADNVWASDFVVQSSDVSFKKNEKTANVHELNVDNHAVAITVKLGNNEYGSSRHTTDYNTNQNPSQFDKAKDVLKEVWNFKTGKKVNLQKILPNNENEKANHNQQTTPVEAD
ncbi:hypothetical protein [Bernardetia sp.]|uniref:hypothetical protein n=1 Tax=Bernardetia sp. TaxID=1937974 RepID=UPI0025C37AC5|nr:hypothetical protein [Bernardetia sp.]